MSERENAGVAVNAGNRPGRRAPLRWIFASAVLSALIFVSAGLIWGQSAQNTAPKPAPAGAATGGKAAAAQNTSAKPVAPNGAHVGITVHGHWIIEVKNPDGSVAQHVAFENSLCLASQLPAPTTTLGYGFAGDTALTQLLLGFASFGPTYEPLTPVWRVDLYPPSPGGSLPTSPCAYASYLSVGGQFDSYTGSPSPGQPNCQVSYFQPPVPFSAWVRCAGLTVTPSATANTDIGTVVTQSGLTLFGNITADPALTYPATIAVVSTNLGLPQGRFNYTFTAATVTPNLVLQSSGQTIAVTVTFSFGSQ